MILEQLANHLDKKISKLFHPPKQILQINKDVNVRKIYKEKYLKLKNGFLNMAPKIEDKINHL